MGRVRVVGRAGPDVPIPVTGKEVEVVGPRPAAPPPPVCRNPVPLGWFVALWLVIGLSVLALLTVAGVAL